MEHGNGPNFATLVSHPWPFQRGSTVYEGYYICSAISTPFFRSLENNLYSFDHYILAKIRKMSYFDPYFHQNWVKCIVSTPLVAFRVDGRCWASLSETWPRSPRAKYLARYRVVFCIFEISLLLISLLWNFLLWFTHRNSGKSQIMGKKKKPGKITCFK